MIEIDRNNTNTSHEICLVFATDRTFITAYRRIKCFTFTALFATEYILPP